MNQHEKLQQWVEKMAGLCKPDHVVWIDGSEEEKERLIREASATEEIVPLNQEKYPGGSITEPPSTTWLGPRA